ncbi:hypothetical protein [Streptosporangium carneum]|uniref:Uncharacterized protein n=1 Tax=Streptosporangium carneum TaxID=47481 RepID=A0A9W6MBI9_9ACTN|nr:hypothetical protein [Streptosporangium carneum]GLK07855.1 hypothetical protein GCM10017600_12600 [Streptosporangium carneum]
MTETIRTTDEARGAALRLTATSVALAGMLPYLTIKIIWLAGGTLGVDDPARFGGGAFFALNLLTFAMDAVGAVIVLAFVMPWGRGIPAGMILPPVWLGTGLLIPIAVQAPLAVLAGLLSGAPLTAPGSPVAGWVYAVVYTGFTCQALGLTAAFLSHARRRWPGVFTRRISDGPASRTRELQVFVAGGVAVVAAVLAAVNLSWLLGSTLGLPEDAVAARSVVFHLRAATNTLAPIAAATGLLTVVLGRSARPLRGPVAFAWLGSGVMFGGSLWEMIVMLTPGAFGSGGVGDVGLLGLVALFTLLTGLVAAMTGAFALVERERRADPRTP